MARFIKKLLGHIGLFREGNDKQTTAKANKDFEVKMAVPIPRVSQGPVLCQRVSGDGGVQGFRWYAEKLQVDEDGDIAEEFLNEIIPEITRSGDLRKPSGFEVKLSTRSVNLRSHTCSVDGNVHQCVEHRGKLRWV
eukprot:Gb_40697 [translate_table: standard]